MTIEDNRFHATPTGRPSHGSTNYTGGDTLQVARLLLAAGATLKDGAIPTGNEAIDVALREHALIE